MQFKNIWIVGGSTGIGKALSVKLAEKGANIAISSRSKEAVEVALMDLKQGNHIAMPLDASKVEEVRMAKNLILNRWATIDMIIYAAGIYKPMRAFNMNYEDARQTFAINFYGMFNSVYEIVPHMLKNGAGQIVLISSVAGYGGLPNSLVYGASKAAVNNFAETLHMDLSDKGIKTHLVCPGFVKTRLTEQNDFKMPALITADKAAEYTIKGIEKGDFDINFPKKFTLMMKLFRILPYKLYFYLIRKVTGL